MKKSFAALILILAAALVYWWLSGVLSGGAGAGRGGPSFKNPTSPPRVIGPTAPPPK